MERCDKCGQRLPIRELPEGIAFSLTKKWIWQAITSWPGMDTESIMSWVYGHRKDGGPNNPKNIHVYIYYMNKQLRPHGLEIHGHPTDVYRVRTI